MVLDETGAKRHIFEAVCQVIFDKKEGDFNKKRNGKP